MAAPHSDALVFFGATGDLAYKKIFPALQAMIRRGHLNVPIIGVASSGWNLDQFKARAKDSLEKHGAPRPGAYAKLCSLLGYIDGDYRDPATFAKLRQALGRRPAAAALSGHSAQPVRHGGRRAGASRAARRMPAWSSRSLRPRPGLGPGVEPHAASLLPRAGHLPHRPLSRQGAGPEPDLLPLRQSARRSRLESTNTSRACRSPWPRTSASQGRGKFYEEAGAIRDVVQNHMLQVIACLAMECPAGEGPRGSSRRARAAAQGGPDARAGRCRARPIPRLSAGAGRGRVTRRSRPSPRSVFTSTTSAGRACRSTCASGKCLPVTATEVMVRFKRPPRPVLDEAGPPPANYYRFRLSPEVVLALGGTVKKPGERMEGESIELIAHHQPPDEMDPMNGYWAMPPGRCNAVCSRRCRRGSLAHRGPGPRQRNSAL